MDYISDRFKAEFPEHFNDIKLDVDNRIFYQYQKSNDEYIETIINKSLYVSNPAKFNDPLDSYVSLKNDSQENDIKTDIRESVLRLKNGENINGVICLTSSFDNQLMWSHYADSHRGICVGYKFKESNWKGADDFILKPVYYKNLTPIPESIAWEDSSNFLLSNDAADAFSRTKNPDWHYEREWRIICKKSFTESRVTLSQLGIELDEIIFGMQVPSWKRIAISQAVISSGQNPKFSKMSLDDETILIKTPFDVM